MAHDEQLGGDTAPATKYMCYSGPNHPVLPDPDPYHVFSTLMLSGGAPGPITSGAVDEARVRRTSVIDLVLEELDQLDWKIDAEDRGKVEAHIEGLRDIEKRLNATPPPVGPSGATCGNATLSAGLQHKLYDNDSFPALVKMQNDLVVAALACDQTRIASVQWSRTFSMVRHTWLSRNAPAHHTNSHETTPEAVDWQDRMSTWYCQQFAYLLGKLSAVKEGDGTLLDHSLAVFSCDMNLGAGHVLPPHVAVLAGGLGGKIKTSSTGRLIDFAGKQDWTQVLVTICQVMGATEVQSVGDLGQRGPAAGITVA